MRILKKELWPYKAVIDMDHTRSEIIEIENWLGESLGIFKGRWNVVYNSKTDYYFRNEKDYVWFTMRWA